MVDQLVHALMGFITAHAVWAPPIVFVIVMGESFVFVAFVSPGMTVLLACGALIAGRMLPFWPIMTAGLAGAVIGDFISYLVGRRYGHLLARTWPFTRYPDVLEKGHAFFARFGFMSIFIGKCLGPFRAVPPLLAGVTKMPAHRFWLANIGSAALWVPALLLPGLIVGLVLSHLGEHGVWKAAGGLAAMLALAAILWDLRRRRSAANPAPAE